MTNRQQTIERLVQVQEYYMTILDRQDITTQDAIIKSYNITSSVISDIQNGRFKITHLSDILNAAPQGEIQQQVYDILRIGEVKLNTPVEELKPFNNFGLIFERFYNQWAESEKIDVAWHRFLNGLTHPEIQHLTESLNGSIRILQKSSEVDSLEELKYLRHALTTHTKEMPCKMCKMLGITT